MDEENKESEETDQEIVPDGFEEWLELMEEIRIGLIG